MAATAKYSVGAAVNHPADSAGKFPAGTGTVSKVTPTCDGSGFAYEVKCDKTKHVLPVLFSENDLTPKS